MTSAALAYYPLDQQQQWLLQATLMEGASALDAWQAWRETTNIEQLTADSYYVLSALYPNLRRHQVQDPHMARLKGVYRRTWYANQLHIKQLRDLLQALHSQQVSTLLLSDMARLTTCYKDYGARVIQQFSLLVSLPDVHNAFNILQHHGWTATVAAPQAGDRLWEPIVFKNPTNFPLILHNFLFWVQPQDYTDQQVWAQSIPVDINGVTVSALSRIDQLLRLALAINQQPSEQPLYALVDAALLVKELTTADWVRLVGQAQRYEMVLPLRYLLLALQALGVIVPPDWVLPSLKKMAISYHELLQYQLLPDNRLLRFKAQLIKWRARWQTLQSSSLTRSP